jgi:O-antigen/teichoic acid export membrane protein
MNNNTFFKHAAVYGMAGLLLQAGGFILLPLYTRCLSPADYGVLEVLGRLAETVGTCLLFGGFRQALLTFYQQSVTAAERARLVGTTLSLLAATCLLGGGLVLFLAPHLASWLERIAPSEGPSIGSGLLRLAVLGVLVEPLTLIPLTLIQARVESTLFVAVNLCQFVFRLALLLVLVVWLGLGVAGVLTALVLTAGLFGIVLCGREITRGASWPDREQARSLLRFALPLVPGGLCFFLLHHGDRFVLFRCAGREEVGIYALGYKLAMVVTTLSLNPLYMVWSAQMYEVARQDDAPMVFGRVFTRVLAAYLLVGLALLLFADEVVALLAGAPYARATLVVPPVLLACFCQAGASLMDAAFYVRHRTALKLGITLSATAVMIVLYAWLIPAYGSIGAALATLGGFAFLAARTWRVSQRIFPVHYEWHRLGALLALAGVLWLTGRALPVSPWSWPARTILWLAAPLAAWHTGLVSSEEKRYVRDSAARMAARFGRAPVRATPLLGQSTSVSPELVERSGRDARAPAEATPLASRTG